MFEVLAKRVGKTAIQDMAQASAGPYLAAWIVADRPWTGKRLTNAVWWYARDTFSLRAISYELSVS